MESFCSEFSLKLDDKGRMLLPAKFRSAFAEGIAISRAPDQCLRGSLIPDYLAQVEALQKKGSSVMASRRLVRAFTSATHDQVPDSQGRVSIPQPLRDYAGLERDVCVIGVGRYIEIWNPQRWAEEQSAAAEALAAMDDAEVDFF